MKITFTSEDLLRRVAQLEAIVTAIGPFLCEVVRSNEVEINLSFGDKEVNALPILHELCHEYISEWYPVETTEERMRRLGITE